MRDTTRQDDQQAPPTSRVSVSERRTVGSMPDQLPTIVPSSGRPMGARRRLARLLVVLDVLGATAAALAAGAVREALADGDIAFALEIGPTLAMIPVLIAGLAIAGCYRPAGAGLGADTFRRFVRGTGASMLLLGFGSFALRLSMSRLYVILVGGFLLAAGLGFRYALRRLARAPGDEFSTRVLVAGADAISCHVAQTLDGDGPSSFHVLGYLRTSDDVCDGAAGSLLGDLDDLPELLRQFAPDAVLASTASLSDADLRNLYLLLEPVDTELILYPSLVEVAARRLDVETVGSFPLIHLSTVKMTPGRRALKRALDFTVSFGLLTLSLPVLLVAALAIKLDTRGPVLFKQQRIGKDGRPFTLLKLRTMVVDAEAQLDDLRDLNEAGDGLFKMREDPRVTRAGRILRRFSVDEIPQFLNVLLGEMSLVGPRPALPQEVEQQSTVATVRRHRLKPGITGHWQVSGRSEVAADEALRMDLYYVENWSLAFDIQILFRTVKVVLGRDGAF